jgi:hypothetical protein
MASWPDGRVFVHSEGQRGAMEFLRALADAPGCKPPVGLNGKPQSWNRELGFHDNLHDEVGDALVPYLSPAERGRHTARRQAAFDAGILHDWRMGRRASTERVVLEARGREREREIVEDRIRSRSRIA